jgi:hypothetical protein
MSTLYAKCPFSKMRCVECPIYRGRHCFIIPTNGRVRTRPPREEGAEWKESFVGFFGELEEQFRQCLDSYTGSL